MGQKFLPLQRVVEHGSKFGKAAKQHRQSYILYGFYSMGGFALLVSNSKKPCGETFQQDFNSAQNATVNTTTKFAGQDIFRVEKEILNKFLKIP